MGRTQVIRKMKWRSEAIVVLLLSFCSITMTVAGCKNLHCYVDYIDTLTCKYNEEETSLTSYSLAVEWIFEEINETCELIPSGVKNEYTCTIDMEDFSYDTECTVFIRATIDENETLRKTCGPFSIGDKFKPRAPFNLSVIFSENYNVSWRTLYDLDIYRSNELAYEFSYKKDAESWLNQKTVQLYEDEKSLVLLQSLFKANEKYVARIRAQPKNKSIYRGQWGGWSTPVSWTTPAVAENSWKNWPYSLMVPFFFIMTFILYVFKWPNCLWKNVWVLIPNPAPFFKPLYMVHHGDFKSWLGSSYPQRTPFESMTFPEAFEVYSQGLLKNASRQDVNSLENQKILLTNACSSTDSIDCRKCDCNKAVQNKDSGSLPMGTQPCPYFNTKDGLGSVMAEIADDSYPCVNLVSDDSNKLNQESVLQDTTNSLVHSNIHLQEGFIGSNMNILDLVPALPEGWEFQDSPHQDDDENVFYSNNYKAFSPDSESSADFGYPEICLDLDTIDSGFCDSECGSPVDSDFANNGTPQKPPGLDSYIGEEEIYERNYVKQWVPSHSILAECKTKNITE